MRIAELEGRWLEFATLLPPEAPASLALGEASLGGMALFAGEVHLLLPPPLITYDYSLTTAHCLLPLTTPYFLLLTTYYLLLTTYYLLLLTAYYCLLRTAHYCSQLLTAYCVLRTAYRLPLTTHYWPPPTDPSLGAPAARGCPAARRRGRRVGRGAGRGIKRGGSRAPRTQCHRGRPQPHPPARRRLLVAGRRPLGNGRTCRLHCRGARGGPR